MPGIIYCVTNPSMNNYCKVGETGKTIKDRMKGLNNTSIPIPFKLDFFIEIDYCKRFNIEKTIHKEIIKFGYDRLPGKEFFKCNPNDIKHIFEKYGTIKYEEKESVKDVVKESVKESVKKYICKTCNKTFARKDYLNNHTLKLNPCKPIKIVEIILENNCEFCKKNFSTNYNLKKHQKGHCKMMNNINNDKIKTDLWNNIQVKFLEFLNNQNFNKTNL